MKKVLNFFLKKPKKYVVAFESTAKLKGPFEKNSIE